MHEMSLLSDLFNKINQIAKQANSDQVTKVSVEIGALAHISPEHFTEHFVEMAQGSIAQDAELAIKQNSDINHPRAQDITLLSIDVADNSTL